MQAATSALPGDTHIVRLNIGGHRFMTTAGTLRSDGENFFTALLSGRLPAALDETGAYFVDRNGRYFEPILDFLRTGEIAVPLEAPWRLVRAEAEFFLVRGFLAYFSTPSGRALLAPVSPSANEGRDNRSPPSAVMHVSGADGPAEELHDAMDVLDVSAASLRERHALRQAQSRDALAALTACLRAVNRASADGAMAVTLVLGEHEGAIGHFGFRRYERPRFLERLQVVSELSLEALMTSESGREYLYGMLVSRGFVVRYLSVPCRATAADALADTTYHDGV
jgi:hypothetical protein